MLLYYTMQVTPKAKTKYGKGILKEVLKISALLHTQTVTIKVNQHQQKKVMKENVDSIFKIRAINRSLARSFKIYSKYITCFQ